MKSKKNIPFINLPNGEILSLGDVIKKEYGEVTIQKFSYGYDIGNRTAIINHLIKKNNFKYYLEIGVRDLKNFDRIKIDNKLGVDPFPVREDKRIITATSDEFFNKNLKFFDLIFIDGLHLEHQVDKDIKNSFRFLNKNGFIIMHDCNPPSEFHQRENYEVDGQFPSWNGTVWRSFAKLRTTKKNISMSCVDCDWGVGIIQKNKQQLFKLNSEINYSLLEKNRKELLNLISVTEFIQKY